MDSDKQLREICKFLNEERILTLSVAADGTIWSASCFYQFQKEKMVLHLMSDINSRHSQLMSKEPVVSGTIISQVSSMMSMKGAQYLARVVPLSDENEVLARNLYCERYPISRVMSLKIWELQLMEIKITQRYMGVKKSLYWMRSLESEAILQ